MGVDADSSPVRSLEATTAKPHDSRVRNDLLHGEDIPVRPDNGHISAERAAAFNSPCRFQGAMTTAPKASAPDPIDAGGTSPTRSSSANVRRPEPQPLEPPSPPLPRPGQRKPGWKPAVRHGKPSPARKAGNAEGDEQTFPWNSQRTGPLLNQSSSAPSGRGTRLKTPLVLIAIAAIGACQPTGQTLPTDLSQTPAELYEGRAILSVGSITMPASAEDHRQSLDRPFSERLGVCQIPTSNAIVEAVNDVIRAGRRLGPDELYLTEDQNSVYGWSNPKGTFIPDIIEMLLIDSQGRSVTISAAARDFDGNYYDYGMAGMEEIYRIIDMDSVWKACHRLYERESILQHD